MAPALRAALLLATLLFPFLPSASAQAGLDAMEVEVGPFPARAVPLQGTVEAPVRIETPCAVPGMDPRNARVTLWVKETPAWARMVVAPSTFPVDPQACEGGRLTHVATVVASVDDQAPAFAPTAFRLAAAWEGGLSNLTGEGEGQVEASYFSILDVVLDNAIQQVPPGELATFQMKVTNLGNDATQVVVELIQADEGFLATAPAPVVLESKQQGGTAVAQDLLLQVRAPEGAGYVNKAGNVQFRIRGVHAEDASLAGDETSVSLLITAKGLDAPGPAPLLVPLVALLAGLALRRRLP